MILLRDVAANPMPSGRWSDAEETTVGAYWTWHIHWGIQRIVAVIPQTESHAVIGAQSENHPVAWWSEDMNTPVYTRYEDARAVALAAGWDGERRFTPSYILTGIGKRGAIYPVFDTPLAGDRQWQS